MLIPPSPRPSSGGSALIRSSLFGSFIQAFVLRLRDQTINSVNGGDARNQLAMRVYRKKVIWLILGAACAALGWVLLTILVR
jgi:hypothetical protein